MNKQWYQYHNSFLQVKIPQTAAYKPWTYPIFLRDLRSTCDRAYFGGGGREKFGQRPTITKNIGRTPDRRLFLRAYNPNIIGAS